MAGYGKLQPASPVPSRHLCVRPFGTVPGFDPLPCGPVLLVPVIVVRHGQRRVVYVHKPCLCASRD